MLDTMLQELDYVINKYSGPDWNTKETANRLVELLTDHRQLVQTERNQVAQGGGRSLREQDFLGPKERARRRLLNDPEKADGERKDYSKYFKAIEAKMIDKKRRDMRDQARKVALERQPDSK